MYLYELMSTIENNSDDIKFATLEMLDKVSDINKFQNNQHQILFKKTIENTVFQQSQRKQIAFADISQSFLEKNLNLL